MGNGENNSLAAKIAERPADTTEALVFPPVRMYLVEVLTDYAASAQ